MTDRRYDCAVCGEWLTGRQTHFCSSRCKKRHQRSAQPVDDVPLKTCDLCGATFRPVRGKQRVCAIPEQASAHCRQLQDQRDAMRLELDEQRWEAACEHCGANTGWEGVGRPRKYCRPACRTAAYRAAKRSATS